MPVRQQLMLLKSRTFYFSFVSAAIRAAARNRLGQLRQSNLPAGLARHRRPPGLATPRHPIIDQRALIAGVSSASSASVRCAYRVAADAPCARSISRGLGARTGGMSARPALLSQVPNVRAFLAKSRNRAASRQGGAALLLGGISVLTRYISPEITLSDRDLRLSRGRRSAEPCAYRGAKDDQKAVRFFSTVTP